MQIAKDGIIVGPHAVAEIFRQQRTSLGQPHTKPLDGPRRNSRIRSVAPCEVVKIGMATTTPGTRKMLL